jgi:hypothetical protein
LKEEELENYIKRYKELVRDMSREEKKKGEVKDGKMYKLKDGKF